MKAVAKYDAETRDDNPENVYTYVTVHVHEHVWSEEWAIDGDYHYHECVAEYCKITDNSEKKSYNMHTYTNDGFCICGRPCEVLDRDGVRRKVVLHGGSAVYMNVRITSISVSFCQHLYGRPVEWVLPCTASERVKVMFLDNLTDLRPLCEPGEYERAE